MCVDVGVVSDMMTRTRHTRRRGCVGPDSWSVAVVDSRAANCGIHVAICSLLMKRAPSLLSVVASNGGVHVPLSVSLTVMIPTGMRVVSIEAFALNTNSSRTFSRLHIAQQIPQLVFQQLPLLSSNCHILNTTQS